MTPRCEDCAFARKPPKDPAPWRLSFEGALECHRYPPIVAGTTLMSDTREALVPGMMFPQVAPNDWCAEWQLPRGRRRQTKAPPSEYGMDG